MLAYTRGMSTNNSTQPTTSASSPSPIEGGNAHPNPGAAVAVGAALPHAYGVHTKQLVEPAPMPIYLGAQNTPTHEAAHEAASPTHEAASPTSPTPPAVASAAEEGDERAHLETEGGRPLRGTPSSSTPAQAYNPTELAKALLALLGILLGLTLALGGWQPHTSDARLGWSHGSINVVEGTDGDTGAMPLSPHDEGVLPAPPNATLRSISPDSPAAPVEMGKTFFGDTSRLAPSVSPWSGGSEA